MAARRSNSELEEGDSVGLTADVTRVHADGQVTVRVHGYGYPVTLRAEHLSLITRREPTSSKPPTRSRTSRQSAN